jgi:hypothetical protein
MRVCIEGLPGHAHQIETVTPLFKAPTFINTVDPERRRDKEIGCFCLWLWTSDPDVIAKEGVLQIAEPVEVTEDYFIRLGEHGLPNLRSGPAKMLDYEVIIHIDRIEDYTSRSGSSSNQSYQSDVSGIPDDSFEEEWPVRHRFSWYNGVPDGQFIPRTSVHDRIRGSASPHDRSPPRGGGGGSRNMQVPPPNYHDMAPFRGGRSGGGGHAHGGQTGRRISGRSHGGDTAGAVEEDPTASARITGGEGTGDGEQIDWKKKEPEKAFEDVDAACRFNESLVADWPSVDPMTEEAASGQGAVQVLPLAAMPEAVEHVGPESTAEALGLELTDQGG